MPKVTREKPHFTRSSSSSLGCSLSVIAAIITVPKNSARIALDPNTQIECRKCSETTIQIAPVPAAHIYPECDFFSVASAKRLAQYRLIEEAFLRPRLAFGWARGQPSPKMEVLIYPIAPPQFKRKPRSNPVLHDQNYIAPPASWSASKKKRAGPSPEVRKKTPHNLRHNPIPAHLGPPWGGVKAV